MPAKVITKKPAQSTRPLKRLAVFEIEEDTEASDVEEYTSKVVNDNAKKPKKHELNNRIEAFKKYCKNELDAWNCGQYLKSFFNESEMQALWGRFKVMLSKAPAETQQAWKGLKGQGKLNFLTVAITKPYMRMMF